MSNLKIDDNVCLLKSSMYAADAFQEEGFCQLKLNKLGKIIKLYPDDNTYLVEFMDEGIKKSNIYSVKEISSE